MGIEDQGKSKKRMKEFKYMTPLQVFVILLLAVLHGVKNHFLHFHEFGNIKAIIIANCNLLFNMSIYWGPFHLTSTPPIDEFF
jgi:uncharacterized protein (DUF111 family)